MVLPRALTFVADVEVIEGLASELIIGWPTLKGTGLLGIIVGTDEYVFDEDQDYDEFDDLWPDVDQEIYEMPKIVGTPSQQQDLRNLCEKYKELFGPVPHGGSDLPIFELQLKTDEYGRTMHPKRQQCRPVSPWIAELIREDTEMRIKNGWYIEGESEFASPPSFEGVV